MKRINKSILSALFFGVLFTNLEGVSPPSKNNKSLNDSLKVRKEQEEYNILRRDEIDNSNTLAIPFDDSEIEDEEEINRDENEEVFPFPIRTN